MGTIIKNVVASTVSKVMLASDHTATDGVWDVLIGAPKVFV